jgi:hypothetical protein
MRRTVLHFAIFLSLIFLPEAFGSCIEHFTQFLRRSPKDLLVFLPCRLQANLHLRRVIHRDISQLVREKRVSQPVERQIGEFRHVLHTVADRGDDFFVEERPPNRTNSSDSFHEPAILITPNEHVEPVGLSIDEIGALTGCRLHHNYLADRLPLVIRILYEAIDEGAQKPAGAELQDSLGKIFSISWDGHHRRTSQSGNASANESHPALLTLVC